MEREKLGSRLGFILLSAGCAIGIGNVWKFPYMAGQYGGGAFVLFYIFFLLILGLPIMSMEFAIGRASRKSPVKAYNVLEKKGQKWHLHGYVALLGNYLLMMFYTTVSGWMLHYFYLTATGHFVNADAEQVSSIFSDMLGQPKVMVFWMLIVVILGFGICSFGLQKGLERITKVMMIALLVIMVVLAVNSVFMDGAKEGLQFYLAPNFEKMKEIGIGTTIVGAMNQAFFTLSLGIGAMAIFGSYIGKERALLGEAVNVAILDTFVALVSGMIIFPACFSFGVEADSGPSLIFLTLPNIFNHIPLGRLWGSLFFIFMAFAAFSTVLAVFENIISCGMDLTGCTRKKAAFINGIAMFFLSLPCVLGYNVFSSFQPFGKGSTIMDLEDFLVSNILLPLGSFVYLLFCVSRYGWGWKNYTDEANTGKGLKVAKWMRGYFTYILPVIVLVLFAIGIKDKFF
ncbi:sodium-dependent transporter [Lachnoclostridium sp. An181]|uniref:sodium-dependent transporter n=1 Tax=Lachnoclostridium sp. An181 TaxID=1965575 RepID=UPI000B394B5B|nr:sodium-dependent transporter [Lachnoclostridium sp. An181]OUP49934.1 sodium-dependent transporter [Lachnoclostridium sp. An181]